MGKLEQPVTAASEADAAEQTDATEQQGLLLHGIVRARGSERALAKLKGTPGDELVEHRGLAALVHAVPYRLPDWNKEFIQQHSATIERAMRRATIVPAPYGIVFRSREHVVDFLEDQHVALDEALSFLDGAFEMRLHIQPSGRRPDVSEGELADQAASFYTSLRRRSRAAFTLPPAGRRVLSAAFLVNRADWVAFVEYADELDADHPEFQFDLTGPWPPYDFVRVAFFPREKVGD
ncbi:MAG: GvpL/GvpF family gas vesicle protein [Gemmatimonadota bacterium]|nr:MAG: GvpL/GvpF family gas vesicle protein [Gemmatimonadota bacterium]